MDKINRALRQCRADGGPIYDAMGNVVVPAAAEVAPSAATPAWDDPQTTGAGIDVIRQQLPIWHPLRIAASAASAPLALREIVRGTVNGPQQLVEGISDLNRRREAGEDTSSDVGRLSFYTGLSNLMGGTAAPEGVLAAGGSRKGGGKGPSKIDSTNIREQAQGWQDVLKWAEDKNHIKRAGTTGKYSGAPEGVDSQQALGGLRRKVDQTVIAGRRGGDWYDRARGGIDEMAGPNQAKRDLASYELAATSPQADPDVNLGFTLQGHNDAVLGAPRERVRTGQQAGLVNDAVEKWADTALDTNRSPMMGHNGGPPLDTPEPPLPLGKKTGMYENNINPNIAETGFGTNDTWHARVFGFQNKDGTPFSGSVTPQMHGFMDGETALAAGRMNERGVPLGPTERVGEWTPAHVQAAAWVEAKARGLMRRYPKLTYEQAFERANKTYKELLGKYTGYGTYEVMPGENTGHLAGLPDRARRVMEMDPRSSWAFLNGGRDAIYESAGLFNRPTQGAQGYYVNSKGQVETNPANIARPMVSFAPEPSKGAGRVVAPHTAGALTKGEALRAYLDAQEMGAWHVPVPDGKVEVRSAIRIANQGPMSKEQMAELSRIGKERGYGQPIDTGEGVTFKDFGDEAIVGKDLKKQMIAGRSDLRRVMPGSDPQLTKYEGNATFYDWSKGEGSGHVTRSLLDVLDKPEAPKFATTVGNSPALRMAAMARRQRDEALAAKYGVPVRSDLQNARSIIANQGIAGLRRALERGDWLPSRAAPVYLPPEEDR